MDTANTSQPKGCFWCLVANVNKNHILNEILNAIYCVFWIMDIRTQWMPNMETDSVNMTEIKREARQRINKVSLQQNFLFICLFTSKNHVQACLRITIAALRLMMIIGQTTAYVTAYVTAFCYQHLISIVFPSCSPAGFQPHLLFKETTAKNNVSCRLMIF